MLASPPTGPRATSPMRSSTWQAHGNAYLLVEDEPLTPERASALAHDHGTDGVLEVRSIDGGEAEIAIWNPDGSQAEMSGNGTRIAARWLAERSEPAVRTLSMKSDPNIVNRSRLTTTTRGETSTTGPLARAIPSAAARERREPPPPDCHRRSSGRGRLS